MALIDSIIGAESGGDPLAKNPRSTALGPAQFIEGTWLDMIAKHRPDLIEGRSPQDILALRTDVPLSRDMATALASDNAGALSSAGLPVTPGSTYLAHFAGPKGAIGILNADPSASAGAILGDRAVKANPFLKDMSAADLRAWADRKMGAKPSAPAPFSVPAAPATAAPVALVSGVPQALAGISDIPSDVAAETVQPMSFQSQQPEEAQPPPMFLPPRVRLNLSNLRSQAPASRRGFSFRG